MFALIERAAGTSCQLTPNLNSEAEKSGRLDHDDALDNRAAAVDTAAKPVAGNVKRDETNLAVRGRSSITK